MLNSIILCFPGCYVIALYFVSFFLMAVLLKGSMERNSRNKLNFAKVHHLFLIKKSFFNNLRFFVVYQNI